MVGVINKVYKFFESIVFAIVKRIYHILGRDFTIMDRVVIAQFVRFSLVGGTSALVSILTSLLIRNLLISANLFVNFSAYIGQWSGFVISVLWSFTWNKTLVYKFKGTIGDNLRALAKTYVTYSFTGVFLNTLLMYLWNTRLGLPYIVALFINSIVGVPINFLVTKFWAFNKRS